MWKLSIEEEEEEEEEKIGGGSRRLKCSLVKNTIWKKLFLRNYTEVKSKYLEKLYQSKIKEKYKFLCIHVIKVTDKNVKKNSSSAV